MTLRGVLSALAVLALALLLAAARASAASATWLLNPASGNWNTGANWTGGAFPNSPGDVATFGASNTTAISVTSTTQVAGITFARGASAYTITAGPGCTLSLLSAGITNSSGTLQSFVTGANENGAVGNIIFGNFASAGVTTQFTNSGGVDFGLGGGFLQFTNNSTADYATINNSGALASGGAGGYTQFSNASTAYYSIINNNSGAASGAGSGLTLFFNTSIADYAQIQNNGGTAFAEGGGGTQFSDASSADVAKLTNNGGVVNGALGGCTLFSGTSAGYQATITNNGAALPGAGGGYTLFSGLSNAIRAAITNSGGAAPGESGGYTQFTDLATANTAKIYNLSSSAANAGAGYTILCGTSTAYLSTIVNFGGTASGAAGGYTLFSGSSTASAATISNSGSAIFGAAGSTLFSDAASAGQARISNTGAPSGGSAGSTQFSGASNAGTATITNSGGIGSGPGGATLFYDSANAASATISGSNNALTEFNDASSAGSAKITTPRGAELVFNDQSTAGSAAVITGSGGQVIFSGNSTAGSAILTSTSGAIYFTGSAAGGSAMATSTSGTFDISGLTDGGLQIGGLSGSGTVYLGHNALAIGSLNLSSTVSAIFTDGGLYGGTGGSLVKVGTGTLALTGHNTYTGSTTVNAGTLDIGGGTTSGAVLSGNPLILGGGTLRLSTAGLATQTFGSTAIAPGASSITVIYGDTLKLGAISRTPGGAVDIASTAGVTGATTTTNSNINGIIGGYATVGGASWAVSNGPSSAITALPTQSYTTTAAAGNTAATYTNANVDVTSSPSPASQITPNTLRFNTAAVETLTLTGTNIIQSGGILVTANVANHADTITGGVIEGAQAGDLVIIDNNPSNSLTISSLIQDNSGPTGLTKSGGGPLILMSGNTYTGPTIVNAGILQLMNDGGSTYTGPTQVNGGSVKLSDPNALQNSTITLGPAGGLTFDHLVNAAGTVFTLGGLAGSGNFSIADTSGVPINLAVGANNANTTYSGSITGGTGSTLTMVGLGTLTLTGSSTYTSPTAINNGGALQIGDGVTRGASIASSGVSGPIQVSSGSFLNVDLVNGEKFPNAVNLSGGGNLAFLASGVNYVTGAIQDDGFGAIYQSGSGTTIYTGDGGNNTPDGSSFSGNLYINSGAFQLGDNGRTAGANLGGATITVNANGVPVSGPSVLAIALANGESFTNTVNLYNGGVLECLNSSASYSTSNTNYISGSISDDGSGLIIQNGSGATIFNGDGSGFSGQLLVNSGTFQLGDNGLTSGVNISAKATLSVNGAATLSVAPANGDTLGSTITLSNGGVFAINLISDNFSFTGSISDDGSGAVIQYGSGFTTYTADGGLYTSGGNTFSGHLLVNAGTFQIGDNGMTSDVNIGGAMVLVSGASSTLIIALADTSLGEYFPNAVSLSNGGAIEFNSSNTNLVTGPISDDGSGSIVQSGNGYTIYTGSSSGFHGGLFVNEGTFQLGDDGTTPGANIGSATVLVTAAMNPGAFALALANGETFSNPISLTQAAIFECIASSTNYVTSPISDDGSGVLIQNGSGTTIYTGSSSGFSGALYVNQGTFQIGNNGKTRGASLGTATITVDGQPNPSILALALANGESFPNAVTLINSGIFQLLASGANYITGSISDDTSGAIIQSGSGTTIFAADGSGFNGSILINAGLFQQTSGLLSPSQTIVGAGNPGSTGTYSLSGGTLNSGIITGGSGTGIFNFNGGALQAGGPTTAFLTNLARANVQSGGATLDTNGFNITIPQSLLHDNTSGAPAVDGGLTKIGAGTLTLSNSNTYTGSTTVTVGALIVSGSLTGTRAASVAPGATMEIDGLLNLSATSTIGGALSGSGSVGPVLINANATLAPGLNSTSPSAGILTANGNVTLTDSTSIFSIRLGVSSATNHDELTMNSGSISLNGATLSLTIGSFFNTPANLDALYVIINGGAGATGTGTNTFAQTSPFTTPGGYKFDIFYASNATHTAPGNDVVIELIAIPEPTPLPLIIVALLATLLLRRPFRLS